MNMGLEPFPAFSFFRFLSLARTKYEPCNIVHDQSVRPDLPCRARHPGTIGFGALILYTHLLSVAEYGIYVVGASIAGIISAIFFAWVRLSVARYQAKSPDLDLRAEAIVAYGGTVLVIACLTPVALLIVRPNIGFGVVAGSLLMSLSLTAFEISQEFRRAQLNSLRYLTIGLMRSDIGLAFGYAAIELGGGGLGLLVGIGASFLWRMS